MSDIALNFTVPLDKGFLRRECPFCCREFKVLLENEELTDVIQRSRDSFMLEQKGTNVEQHENMEKEFTCPYCGQKAPETAWWTQEQAAHIKTLARNVMAEVINEQFIRSLKTKFRGSNSGPIPIRFEGKEIEQQEAWLSPEVDDMEVFELPCCNRKIKIEESWSGTIYCFFCGFPYNDKKKEQKYDGRVAL